MIHPIPVNKFSRSLARILENIFYGIEKSFIGVQEGVLNLIPKIFPVNSLKFFLPRVVAEISGNNGIAILTILCHNSLLIISCH